MLATARRRRMHTPPYGGYFKNLRTSPHGWKPSAAMPGIILALPPVFFAINQKQDRTMKELYNIMMKDFQEENFTLKEWIIYGVCAPIALILLCGLAELIEPTI